MTRILWDNRYFNISAGEPKPPTALHGLDVMTICDYYIVMISVNIAVLKAKLSFYLGQVKLGNEIVVMDRNTPVARMLPSTDRAQGLVLIKAKKSPSGLKAMRFLPAKRRTNSVELLREERERR